MQTNFVKSIYRQILIFKLVGAANMERSPSSLIYSSRQWPNDQARLSGPLQELDVARNQYGGPSQVQSLVSLRAGF
jgi:hypothetical protein